MRGKLVVRFCEVFLGRIIPARAGQTACYMQSYCLSPDHPRACGANCGCCCGCWLVCGSSPRVRGKPAGSCRVPPRLRIIPARAGQTRPDTCPLLGRSDHPRACGANLTPTGSNMVGLGSSPRVRGKPLDLLVAVVDLRIIPARAGQTRHSMRRIPAIADHPRACGANAAYFCTVALESGSSPRVRGKQLRGLHGGHHLRIIPARAGQTRPPSWWSSRTPDHPRACGANARSHSTTRSASGSSPRVRGKPIPTQCGSANMRIIPARAGQTPACVMRNLPIRGSSPRVRGKPCCFVRNLCICRIIPARAGQTRILACPHGA